MKYLVLAITVLGLASCATESATETAAAKVDIAYQVSDESNTDRIAKIEIEGMTCAMGCAKMIEKKLNDIDGVADASVDFEGKLATISYDNGTVKADDLVKCITTVADGTYSVPGAVVSDKKVEESDQTEDEEEMVHVKPFKLTFPDVFGVFVKVFN